MQPNYLRNAGVYNLFTIKERSLHLLRCFLLSLPFLSILKQLRRNQTEPNESTTADTEVSSSTIVL